MGVLAAQLTRQALKTAPDTEHRYPEPFFCFFASLQKLQPVDIQLEAKAQRLGRLAAQQHPV